MIKLRIEETKEAAVAFANEIAKRFEVRQESPPYANRGKSKLFRVYLELGNPRYCEFKKLPHKPVQNLFCAQCDFMADAFDVPSRWSCCPGCGTNILKREE